MIEYTYDIVVFLPMNNVEYLHDDLDSVRKKKKGWEEKNIASMMQLTYHFRSKKNSKVRNSVEIQITLKTSVKIIKIRQPQLIFRYMTPLE